MKENNIHLIFYIFYLKVFACGMQALRGINLRENILSDYCYPKGAINRGYQLFNLIKSIFRSVIVFLDVIVNQAESQHELKKVFIALNKTRKVRESVHQCIFSSTLSKTLFSRYSPVTELWFFTRMKPM